MAKVKSINFLNGPSTKEEKDKFERTISKALALAIYRSFSSMQYDSLINQLKVGG